MTFNDTHRVEETTFEGDGGSSITGTAVYDYTVEECLDADHGGRDGLEVTHCELAWFELSGLNLWRGQIVDMTDKATVARVEESVRDAMQETLDDGEAI